MNQIYEKNLKTLEDLNPRLKKKILGTSPSNNHSDKITYIGKPFPNIMIGNKTIHSRKNPYAEAEKLIKNTNVDKIKETVFLFLGMGFGYHIKLFIQKYGRLIDPKKIIVVEKNPEIVKLVMKYSDISFLRKVTIFIDEKYDTLQNYFNSIDPITFGGYRIIKLKGALITTPDYYLSIERQFKEILSSKISDILTRFSFETLWIRNIIENIPNLIFSSPINLLKGVGKNGTTFVIGAGPSLYNQLKALKHLSSWAFIITVDTALPTLLKFGIIPDMVVTLDGQFHSLYDFSYLFINNDLYPDRPILVYDILAFPKIIKEFSSASYFTSSLNILKQTDGEALYADNPFVHYIKQTFLPFDGLPCGGSVLTTAMELAIYMNFAKIILIGADLSYTDFKTHVNSSPLYDKFFILSNRFLTIETKNIQSISNRNIVKIPGIKSKEVLADYVLLNYKNWIEARDIYSKRVLNSTDNGINISNLSYVELKDISKILTTSSKPSINNNVKTVNKVALQGFLLKIRKDINYLIEMIENKEFSYEKLWRVLPYFHNLIIESEKVFKDQDKAANYFYNFARFFKKIINKSLNRLNKNLPSS